MAWPIKSNPDGCVNPERMGNKSCIECYYSQVESNTWCGSKSCWNAQCLVLDVDRLTDSQRKDLHLA